jgi:hypothetical protein
MTTNKVIRASSLPTYQDCERLFAAKTIPDLIEAAGYQRPAKRSSWAAAVGTATHANIAKMLIAKRDTGATDYIEPDAEIMDALAKEVRDAEPDDTITSLSVARTMVDRMSRAFAWSLLPLLNPVYIEQHFRASIGDGWELSGHVDHIGRDALGRLMPDDVKTTKRLPPGGYQSQMGVYEILTAANLPGEELSDTTRLLGLQRVSPRHTQPDPVIVTYDREQCENLAWSVIDRAKENVEKFEANGDISVFLPNASSNLCSKKFCPIWGTDACTYGKGA